MSAVKPTYRSFPLPPAPSLTTAPSPKTTEEIVEALKSVSSDFVLEIEHVGKGDPIVVIAPGRIQEIVAFLRDDARFACSMLSVISAVDHPAKADKPEVPGRIELVYVLFSHKHRLQILLKAKLNREQPRIASITELYRAANWYERECFDMLGVHFEGHPHLERILLPPDWVGHPLRKDYVFPEEYNGMKVPL